MTVTREDLKALRAEMLAAISEARSAIGERPAGSQLGFGLVALGLVLGGVAGGFALGRYVAPQQAPIINVTAPAAAVNVHPAVPLINVQPQVTVNDPFTNPSAMPVEATPLPEAIPEPKIAPALGVDLSFWKVTLPVNAEGQLSGEGDASEVTQLQGFSLPPYFDVRDDSITFMAPTNSARTGGSNYPRSELREMDGRGDEFEWTIENGGYLAATLKVNEVPTTSEGEPGRIVIGQIHGPDDELCRLYYDNGRLYFFDDKAGPDQKETQFVLTAADGSEPNIPLGAEFSYAIDVDDKDLVVSATYGGVSYRAVDPISAFWPGKPLYFKAGVYVQVGMEGTDAGTVGTGQGSATFMALSRPAHD